MSKLNIVKNVSVCLNQIRTRTTCSRQEGKEKSVKTAMQRYFRLNERIWIRAQPGYHHRLYLKPPEKRFALQQAVLLKRTESKMVERMAGRYFKKLKIENFVDPPFVYYHPYMNKVNEIAGKAKKTPFYP